MTDSGDESEGATDRLGQRATNASGPATTRRNVLQLLGAASSGSVILSGTVTAAEEVQTLPYRVDADDGTRLRGHVHFKQSAVGDDGAPLVLVYSPYWNASGTKSEDAPSVGGGNGTAINRLIDEGYVVAAVSWRGTGDSEGCFGWGSRRDQQDATLIVDDLAEESYCNGRVGMLGFSLDGMSISMALSGTEPDSLKAVVGVDSVIDLWSLSTYNGAVFAPTSPTSLTLDDQNALGTRGGRYGADLAALDRLGCTQNNVNNDTAFVENTATGVRNEFFEERDYRNAVYNSSVPMLVTNGIRVPKFPYDAVSGKFGDAHFEQFRGLFEKRDAPTRMILGQHGHQYPTRDDFFDQMIAWFDHYLSTEAARKPRSKVQYEDDTGTWHTANKWPPRNTTESLHLGDGTLSTSGVPATIGKKTFQSDESDPGLSDERCDDGTTQAVYASEPLDASVHIAGRPTFNLMLESTLDGGNLCCLLYHTPGDGTCPDPEADEFGRLYADLKHWDELGTPKSFPTFDPTPVSFEGAPLATEVPAGHRIVLVVSGGSDSLVPAEDQPLLSVLSGVEESRIDLPVIRGNL